MIAFEPWQIDTLDSRQQELSLRKITGILREQYPERTAELNDDELYAKVILYQKECNAMNLQSEWSLAQYARFNMESNDGASLPPAEADYIFPRGMYDLRRTYRQRKLDEQLVK